MPWSDSVVYWETSRGTPPTTDEISQAASSSDYENGWNHWVFTKNASTGSMKMYLNGEEFDSGTGKTRSMSGITSFQIGSLVDLFYGSYYRYHGLVDEVRIYDDELSASKIRDIYALGGQEKATSPSPADDATSVSRTATLSWTASSLAAATNGHDVYLSWNRQAVEDATASDISGTYLGRQNSNSYTCDDELAWNDTYYWRVDEVNGTSICKGDVLSFTVEASNDPNFIAWYKFDETSGTMAKDYSGYNHYGRAYGSNWNANGQIDGCVSFANDVNIYNWVALNANIFDYVDTQLTITVWQNGDVNEQPLDSLLIDGQPNSLTICVPRYRNNDPNVWWGIGGDQIVQAASTSEYEGQWNHWAFTKDSVAGQMKIYLNGVEWLTGTGKTAAIGKPRKLTVGANSGAGDDYYGLVDEIRFYNKVLDINDINDVKNFG